jgi:cytidylate kinase
LKIAIDGPSGAGKSTAAKNLARELKITYLDTGAMYRAVALKVLRAGKRADVESDVLEILKDIDIEIVHMGGCQHVYIDREDVTDKIRTPEVAKGASDVSAFKDVRLKLVELQRQIAGGSDVVMDGRDIGTFVFPNADFKFYLTSSEEERAKRRFQELRTGDPSLTFDKCLAD